MSGGLHNSDLDRVLEATDIVDLIGQYVSLRRQGREMVGLCPFHDDRRPSMFVSPHKSIFKCFACGAGGSALTFVMKRERLEFVEALRFLADRAGIELTPRKPKGAATGTGGGEISRSEIVGAHRSAAEFFRAILRHPEHGRVGRAELERRGISAEMVERFQIGLAPDRWDGLAATLEKKGVGTTASEACGLIMRNTTGGWTDRFRNRLMFPIWDAHGDVIAFGGRTLDANERAKYLNSPEHARFHKSRTLYAAHLAREAIRREERVIVVEGYTDVIACFQAGMENVVGTMGTALTDEHARALERLCPSAVLVFDGDTAGVKAADRAVEVFFATGMDVRIVILPDELDPADLLAQPGGAERMRGLVEGASEAFEFLFAQLREAMRSGGETVAQRELLIREFAERLGRLGFHRMGPVRRDLTLARLAEIVRVRPESLLAQIPRPRELRGSSGSSEGDARREGARERAERAVLGCLLTEPRVLGLVRSGGGGGEGLCAEWFSDGILREIFVLLEGLPAERRSVPAVLSGTEDGAIHEAVAQISAETERVAGGMTGEAIAEAARAAVEALRRVRVTEGQEAERDRIGGSVEVSDLSGYLDRLRETCGNPRRAGGVFRTRRTGRAAPGDGGAVE